ncbi:MAG: winged helix-turn-helix domain-containing protein [Pararhizobium sp.]
MTRVTLRFDFDTGAQLGPGKIRLLQLIGEKGSIRAAGEAMGMSYRRAWLLCDSLNRMFLEPVVDKKHGGRRGGGAALTAFGADLVATYRRMEDDVAARLTDDIRRLGAALDPSFRPDDGRAGEEEGA